MREGAELLRDNVGGKLSPEQREIVRIVRENTLSLQKLIEDLLAYHQTRALEPATLGPVVAAPRWSRRVLREQKLAALARMITFDDAAAARGRRRRRRASIRTIVDNLVSNAIKYSPRSGAIALALGVDGGFAVLDVVDHGPGIAPERARADLRSFYQGTAPLDGRVKGSGLGLAIAREYALAHGGRIEVLRSRRRRARRALSPLAAARRPAASAVARGAKPRRSPIR